MADIQGCKTICDCCGEEIFRLYTGEQNLDGGYTRFNTYEPLPDGWRKRAEIGMLCPDCCPYNDTYDCVEKSANDVISLINHQKAKIDDLKRDTIPKMRAALERANRYGIDADKENERLKAEIEELKKENKVLNTNCQSLCMTLSNRAKVERVAAINEFAALLKKRYKDFCVDESDMSFVVDGIVREI